MSISRSPLAAMDPNGQHVVTPGKIDMGSTAISNTPSSVASTPKNAMGAHDEIDSTPRVPPPTPIETTPHKVTATTEHVVPAQSSTAIEEKPTIAANTQTPIESTPMPRGARAASRVGLSQRSTIEPTPTIIASTQTPVEPTPHIAKATSHVPPSKDSAIESTPKVESAQTPIEPTPNVAKVTSRVASLRDSATEATPKVECTPVEPTPNVAKVTSQVASLKDGATEAAPKAESKQTPIEQTPLVITTIPARSEIEDTPITKNLIPIFGPSPFSDGTRHPALSLDVELDKLVKQKSKIPEQPTPAPSMSSQSQPVFAAQTPSASLHLGGDFKQPVVEVHVKDAKPSTSSDKAPLAIDATSIDAALETIEKKLADTYNFYSVSFFSCFFLRFMQMTQKKLNAVRAQQDALLKIKEMPTERLRHINKLTRDVIYRDLTARRSRLQLWGKSDTANSIAENETRDSLNGKLQRKIVQLEQEMSGCFKSFLVFMGFYKKTVRKQNALAFVKYELSLTPDTEVKAFATKIKDMNFNREEDKKVAPLFEHRSWHIFNSPTCSQKALEKAGRETAANFRRTMQGR